MNSLKTAKNYLDLKIVSIDKETERKAKCPDCNGTGKLEPGLICGRCKGTGQIEIL